MTTTKSQAVFFLGIVTTLIGTIGLLVSIMPIPWLYGLIVIGLLLVNIGLFWMGQLLSCKDQYRAIAPTSTGDVYEARRKGGKQCEIKASG